MGDSELTRRDFLHDAAAAGLVLSIGATLARAQLEADDEIEYPDIGVGMIGCGQHGRALLGAMALLPYAKVKGVADISPTVFRATARVAPEAKQHEDYRALLDDPEIAAVFVATPTHQHKQVVLDALAAGKHVYCESPLAYDLAEAKEIARAGAAATTKFCVGQQQRAYPLAVHCRKFVTTGVLANPVSARAQFRKKLSWRRPAATPERERELNWRLYQETSLGLVGEIGIHPIDYLCWSLGRRPKRVSGLGSTVAWKEDDRTVADTVLCTYELDNGVPLTFDGTLGGSYGGDAVTMVGTDGTIFMHGPRAWLIKEADSPQMGWEIYAHKYDLIGELGIIMVANSTKFLEEGKTPGEMAEEDIKAGRDEWYYACEHFLQRCHDGEPVACGAEDGYAACVLAHGGNQAVSSGTPFEFTDQMFSLA